MGNKEYHMILKTNKKWINKFCEIIVYGERRINKAAYYHASTSISKGTFGSHA